MNFQKDANILILTGAGISAESGLETFRASDGLWENHRVEDVATPEAFMRDPHMVQTFYNHRRKSTQNAQPNAAHHALARLEEEWAGDVLLVTQNIDDLHERGGSRAPIHMHGEVFKAFCIACDERHAVKDDLSVESICPNCGATAAMRPDIVWFGEIPYHMDRIDCALANCDLFISIGTSGNVYPAAGFTHHAKAFGAICVELNLEPSINAQIFDDGHYGLATEIVPEFVETLLKS